MYSLLYADYFVRLAETGLALQKLIDIVHTYSKLWCFEANVKVCCFSKVGKVSDGVVKAFLFWILGESLPVFDSYYYSGIEFSCDGSWEVTSST